MKKTALILLATLLASCTNRTLKPPTPTIESVPTSTIVPLQQAPVNSSPIPMPPKINFINWQIILLPMVQQMLTVKEIKDGSMLLVNTLKNATNGSVQTVKATAELILLINKDGSEKFKVIGTDKLNAARQTLGLSADDSLESCSKAVGVARYLNVEYVLYSAVSGDVKASMLTLQLILVKTGEIIWSSNGLVQD